jgi:isopenicillin N synthase-like dioxygenase
MSVAPSPVSSSDAAEIPVLDLAPYLSGHSAARERLARQLCHALENIGFYFIKGHGVPQSLIDAAFAATARFHAQPLDRKMSCGATGTMSATSRCRAATIPRP